MSGGVGLRERKKAATRAALSAAANRLAIERGVDHVTVDAIAAEADVSPRTFHNYFSSREEAIVASIVDYGQKLTDELRGRPAGEPIWDGLHAVVVGSVDQKPANRAQVVAQIEMILNNPTVLINQLAALDAMRRRFAEVIGERTGTDPDRDMYPHLLAGAAASALKIATEMWATTGQDRGLADLVDDAMAMARAGFPEPAAGRPGE